MKTKIPKQKILYVITKSNWGGAQRYVFELAIFSAKNYDVTVVLGGDGSLKTKLNEEGIRTLSLPSLKRDVSIFSDFCTLRDLIHIFKTEKPDIIHINSSKIGALGALAGRIAHVPKIIFTAHGWAFREERPPYQKFLIKVISMVTIMMSHQVVTVSKRDLREGKNLFFTHNKLTLIYNGIKDETFKKKDDAREEILNTLSTKIQTNAQKALWVGTIGELHKNKGHIFALEALSLLPKNANVFFFIIGEGEERNTLEKKIKDYQLEHKVFLLGKKDDAVSLLNAFNIFLFPSLKEGLPYAVLEAGISGVPVIASAVGGIPEVITDMQTGVLIRPKSAEEIIHAIEYVVHHPIETIAFSKKLRSNIKKDFSLKKMLAQTEKLYCD